MKPITRFAPTISGKLHLGTLFNALITFCYARKYGGVFNLRLDGQKVDRQRRAVGEQIIADMKLFGLEPDHILWQCERRDLYKQVFNSVLNNPRVYFCDCSEVDIFDRYQAGGELKAIIRPEKYPSPCGVKRVRVYRSDVTRIVEEVPITKVKGNIEARGQQAYNVLVDDDSYWMPFEVGYQGKQKPVLDIFLGRKHWITAVQIEYLSHHASEMEVVVGGRRRVKVYRPEQYLTKFRRDVPHESGRKDFVSFVPVLARRLQVRFLRTSPEIRVEYFYDNYCRERELGPEVLRKASGVARVKDPWFDVAIWFGKMVDLCLTSAIDDKEMGVTHSIRGIDIEPFSRLEAVAAGLIGYNPNNYFHPLVVECHNKVKLSKFVESTPVRSYVEEGIKPEAILTWLAVMGGWIPCFERIYDLHEIVTAFEPTKVLNHERPDIQFDEQSFVELCKYLSLTDDS